MTIIVTLSKPLKTSGIERIMRSLAARAVTKFVTSTKPVTLAKPNRMAVLSIGTTAATYQCTGATLRTVSENLIIRRTLH